VDRKDRSIRTRARLTVVLVAIAAAVAALAAVQQGLRLLQVSRLAGTCAVTTAAGCRRLDVPSTVDALHRLDQRSDGIDETFFQYSLVDSRVGWVISYVGLAGDEANLGPIADQISGTFRLSPRSGLVVRGGRESPRPSHRRGGPTTRRAAAAMLPYG
jgi:hypothetical protein